MLQIQLQEERVPRRTFPFSASQGGLLTQIQLVAIKFYRIGASFSVRSNYDGLIPGRGFEADVAIPELKIACEYQGGAFLKISGHKNFKGVQRDHFKANEAQLNGWLFLQFGPVETKTGEAMNVVERAIRSRIPGLTKETA
jgi:hypothetical protein